jgi:hypothetical protein
LVPQSFFVLTVVSMIIPNLLLIAGTGTKSGKTSIACRLIEQFSNLSIVAIKISPHFHETTPGLKLVWEEENISIFRETDMDSSKDTSRMLHSGAAEVYFAKVLDNRLLYVFNKIMELIPAGTPVICESPALRNFAEPGVFIIMSSDTTRKRKNINNLLIYPNLRFEFEKLNTMATIPVVFEDGMWRYVSQSNPD